MGCSQPKPAPKTDALPVAEGAQAKRTLSGMRPERKLSIRLAPSLSEFPVVRAKYKLLDIIGHGKYGVIYKAETKTEPPQFVAIKIIKVMSESDRKQINEEMKILQLVDHPNIIKYIEMLQDDQYIFFVMEYCSGGELFDKIASKECFLESEAAVIIEKMLYALNYIHGMGIAHRDIKPENIMYVSKDQKSEIKIIDFGLAKLSDRAYKLYSSVVGTPFYLAPEVIDGAYTYACDIWSLGVVLHLLLSGYLPFKGETQNDIFTAIKKGGLDFSGPEWQKVSDPGKDLIRQLLCPDEVARPTAEKALRHEWFQKVKTYSPDFDALDRNVMGSLKKYKQKSAFQKACIRVFVKNLPTTEIENLAELFHALDKDRSGFITTQEFLEAFHQKYPLADIKDLVAQIDTKTPGQVEYSGFVAATLDTKAFLTEERLWALFQLFDIDNKGYLTPESILAVLNQCSIKVNTKEDIVRMMKQEKVANPECIKFHDFKKILLKMNFNVDEPMLAGVFDKASSDEGMINKA